MAIDTTKSAIVSPVDNGKDKEKGSSGLCVHILCRISANLRLRSVIGSSILLNRRKVLNFNRTHNSRVSFFFQ